MGDHQSINPSAHASPKGFSYAISSHGERTVHFAGHTSVDAQGQIVGRGDMPAQFEQALRNLRLTAEAAGVAPRSFVKLTLFVTDIEAYQANLEAIGAAYRRLFGKYFPAMTLVEVSRLWDPEALIEVEAVAVTGGGA